MTAVQTLKLVLLGDSGVGKTSIVSQFVYNDFKQEQEPTYGASFMSKVITINELDHQSVRFQIWDTAGQEKYRGLTPMYYRDSAAAICVYDITNMESFKSIDSWVEELHNNTADCLIAVVGNKNDLSDKEEVRYQDAKEFATKKKTLFHSTSAKDRVGIDEVFVDIAKTLIERRISKLSTSKTKPQGVQIKKPGSQKQKGACCK